jgi:hypothetical protein
VPTLFIAGAGCSRGTLECVRSSPPVSRQFVNELERRGWTGEYGAAVNDSSVTLRGYRVANGRFEFVSSIGSDFDGHGLFIKELQSPVPAERWVLAWGPLFGFNGTKVRIRLYSYDGHQFRTLWSPEDIYTATIRVNASGYTIDHLDEKQYFVVRTPPYYVQDEYMLGTTGPRLVSSHSLPE